MAVVAVLLIHIERNAVVSINPNIKLEKEMKQCLINVFDLKSQAQKWRMACVFRFEDSTRFLSSEILLSSVQVIK